MLDPQTVVRKRKIKSDLNRKFAGCGCIPFLVVFPGSQTPAMIPMNTSFKKAAQYPMKENEFSVVYSCWKKDPDSRIMNRDAEKLINKSNAMNTPFENLSMTY